MPCGKIERLSQGVKFYPHESMDNTNNVWTNQSRNLSRLGQAYKRIHMDYQGH